MDSGEMHAIMDAAVGHHQAGRLDEAESLYRSVIEKVPEQPDALHLLGVVHLQKGENSTAEELIRKAINLSPDNAEYHNNLGNVLYGKGKPDEAEESFREALRLDANSARAYNNLGNLMRERGRLEDAEACYRKTIALAPEHFTALGNLGNVLRAQFKFTEAEQNYRQALAINPRNGAVHGSLGNALQCQGRIDEAIVCYRTSLEIDPTSPLPLNSLGNAFKRQGKWQVAIEHYHKAIALDPDYTSAHYGLAILNLALGKFEKGWAGYLHRNPARLGARELFRDTLPKDLSGKKILLIRDQGLGDEIFFLRFAPELKRRGGEVSYVADAKIAPIIRRLSFFECVQTEDQEPEPADYTLSVGDLPFILGATTATEFPPPCPLPVDQDRVAKIKTRLDQLGPPPYVGVTWRAGAPLFLDDLFKEAPLDHFAMALKPAIGTIVALQRNPKSGEINQFSERLGRPVHDFTALNDELEDMLALLSLLDEYVTVSNTNVHLRAGAGRPSRVLIPQPPEFRWMTEGENSPWYPGSKIYRQAIGGGWSEPFETLSHDLMEAIGSTGP